ncbi:SlyX protein [Ectothiorhodospira shaposhnikovii]|uniref:SlyX family protein n=1 Tax=Ectothiorhodospira shaposhnikovii TaxID=1054 RepID=UPI00190468CF|nr:SlyX family protein [Ectothiorhodospira shaposhnikovii]MBK1674669.1 SlyX protein [Ectothiorhodospira shaposhnikovii]
MSDAVSERMVELEIRMAHQEALCQDLNDVVTRQQQEIDRLQLQVEGLRLRLLELMERHPSGQQLPEPPPPHY